MKQVIDLAADMVSFIKGKSVEWIKNKMESQPPLLKIMKRFGVSELKPKWDSVYCHALLEFYPEAEPVEIITLLAEKKVMEAFKSDLHKNQPGNTEPDGLRNTLEQEFLHNKKHSIVNAYFNGDVSRVMPQVTQFAAIYDQLTIQTAQPFLLKMYNENKTNSLRQAEIIERKSFSFQAGQYMDDLVSDFEKAFPVLPGKGPTYIDLNGETRHYKADGRGLGKIARREAGVGDMVEPGGEQEEAHPAEPGFPSYTSDEHRPLDAYMNRWLADDGLNFLMIVGEYGTGKTTFLRHMARQLALDRSANEKAITDEKQRIPLYMPLRDFEKNMSTFVVNRLNRMGIEDINYAAFEDRLENGELLVMLDGFDEMTQRIDADEMKRNFEQVRALIKSRPKSKVILTSRHEYFRSLADMEEVVKYTGNSNYAVVYLMPFDDDQIQRYLCSHIDDPESCWENIKKTFDLRDLAKRPVLLQLIVDYLPGLLKEKTIRKDINASDLYERCIKDELGRKAGELRFKIESRHRLEILERLAVWMFLNDTLSFDVALLMEGELDFGQYFPNQTRWQIEKYLNEFLTFTFLLREADNRFRISHKSFRDYLTATAFVREINTGKPHHFGKNELTVEIHHFVLEQKPNKEKLIHLVETARGLKEDNQYQGTNAANIVLKMDNTALKGRDLSHCQLRGVDFMGCDLTGTDLSHGELRDCWFDGAILTANYRDVNVENSTLQLNIPECEDIKFISAFNGISFLNLMAESLSDLTPLLELKRLTRLWLQFEIDIITNLAVLSDLKGLTELYLNNNLPTDLTPLTELKQLKILYLNETQKITLAQQLEKLKEEIPGLQILVMEY